LEHEVENEFQFQQLKNTRRSGTRSILSVTAVRDGNHKSELSHFIEQLGRGFWRELARLGLPLGLFGLRPGGGEWRGFDLRPFSRGPLRPPPRRFQIFAWNRLAAEVFLDREQQYIVYAENLTGAALRPAAIAAGIWSAGERS
jgi:hypothetical protein